MKKLAVELGLRLGLTSVVKTSEMAQGIAVGIDNTGDRIVVGAPYNPGGGNFSGHMRMLNCWQ